MHDCVVGEHERMEVYLDYELELVVISKQLHHEVEFEPVVHLAVVTVVVHYTRPGKQNNQTYIIRPLRR